MTNHTYKSIWDNLSTINVNEHVKVKNGLSYLSWTFAWEIMMEHYPDMQITWHGMSPEMPDIFYYKDGSASVACTVTIGSCSRFMWLSVMSGYKNSAVKNPDSRDISDAKQRCMVKCFAMFGLGMYIYAGEDLPRSGGKSDEVENAHQKLRELAETIKEERIEIPSNVESNARSAYRSRDLKTIIKSIEELSSYVST